nr:universal stress protein [Pseudoduganella buxea]
MSSEIRIGIAARLAAAFPAHLVGTALTGISRFVEPGNPVLDAPAVAARCARLRSQAGAQLDRFEAIARAAGVATTERVLIDDQEADGLVARAACCDLAVLGQSSHAPAVPGSRLDLAEHVLLRSGRPVLVLPDIGAQFQPDGKALVAWDGSPEANRALVFALPLLRLARQVTIVMLGDPGQPGAAAWVAEPADIARYLGRHGIGATVAARDGGDDVAQALLSFAADESAGLLVMGAYGHARFRELLLGGVTATILQSMTLPVLMAH